MCCTRRIRPWDSAVAAFSTTNRYPLGRKLLMFAPRARERRIAMMKGPTIAAAALACCALIVTPELPAQAAGVVLAPHRAVYELSLLRAGGKRPVASVRGRILYDFSGNS